MVRPPYLPGQETRGSGLPGDGGKLWELRSGQGSAGTATARSAIGALLLHLCSPRCQLCSPFLLIPPFPLLLSSSSWPFPAMLTGRRTAVGTLMHPCRNAWKPKTGAPFSLDGSAGKMSFLIHRGNSDELNRRPGITQANPFLGVGARLLLTRAVERLGRALPGRTRVFSGCRE